MILTRAIKLFDRLAGPFLLAVMPTMTNVTSPESNIQKILVIRPGGMGDALLLLPTLKKLHLSNKVQIDILCEPRNQSVFECCFFVNKIFSYQNPILFFSLFKKQYDAVIDTEQSHYLSAITARFIKAKVRIGFNTFNRSKLFNKSINYQPGYEAVSFWKLFATLFDMQDSFKLDLPYLRSSSQNQHLYANLKKIICLFPGATTVQRLWPTDRWAQICDWVYHQGFTPVLIGGSMEIPQCRKILRFCNTSSPVNLCGKLSISQTVHLFEQSDLLVSTDSGILHLGVMCGTPTISLFGPSDPKKWGPKSQQDSIIYKHAHCSPCAKFGEIPPCANKNICMQNISTDNVLKGLKKIIKAIG